MSQERREALSRAQEIMTVSGMRVLALAHREVPERCPRDQLEEDLVFDGFVGFADPPRPEVPDAIRRCREAGIRGIMVTGNHPQTALAIARQASTTHLP
jgi:sodium/potassium-transporting ATPase subunit alpha